MKIHIIDSAATNRDYSAYYDRKQAPFSYNEIFDRSRGRQKTATLTLFRDHEDFVIPKEDEIVMVYRDAAETDLVFGGVISRIEPVIRAKGRTEDDLSDLFVREYALHLSGYDPVTLDYAEVVAYERINTKSGTVIKELLSLYAPWIIQTNIEEATSPVLNHIRVGRRKLSSIIQAILEKTGWIFYVDDEGVAYFDAPANTTLNWGLTEGTSENEFPEFDPFSLHVKSNADQVINDITLIGGEARGAKVHEEFIFNGQEGSKPLKAVPFGLTNAVKFFDKHDAAGIDLQKWYEEDTGNKITQSSGRLQIASGVNDTGIVVTKQLFSRDENLELRFAEIEIVSYGSGKVTVGVSNGQRNTTITNFLHALELDSSVAYLRVREGATVTNFTGIPIGVGIYSVRIKVKSSGGAIYYIQGGRSTGPTDPARELGELGSKEWTRITETSADTTNGLAAAVRADTSIGATVIRTQVTKEIDVQAVLLSGGQLGENAPVGVDTNLTVGLAEVKDFEIDAFIQNDRGNATIQFFTDNKPLGRVRVTYWEGGSKVRERVFDNSAKTTVNNRSALLNDDGTRSMSLSRGDEIIDHQDARDALVEMLGVSSTIQYQGTFQTNSALLALLTPTPGERPLAGSLLTITLPNGIGITTTELITNISARDEGAEIMSYDVQFGEGRINFERLLLALKVNSLIEIVDDEESAIAPDSEEKTTASISRIAAPGFVSSLYDDTGVAISWSAVSGASNYEVRDNLFRGQGQGGSLVYQQSGATSYSISAANIKAYHKKRKFIFFIWTIDSGGKYSKFPLVISVENPAPVPQPIKDIIKIHEAVISIRFHDEREPDITTRVVQYAHSRDMLTNLVEVDVDTSEESYEFEGVAAPIIYIRYGLKDSYTDDLDDMLFSGIRDSFGIKASPREVDAISDTGLIGVPENVVIETSLTNPVLAGNELRISFDIPTLNGQSYWGRLCWFRTVNTFPAPDYDAANSSYNPTGITGTGVIPFGEPKLIDTTKSWPDLSGKKVLVFTKKRPTSGTWPYAGGVHLHEIDSNTATEITFVSTMGNDKQEFRWGSDECQYYIIDETTQEHSWEKVEFTNVDDVFDVDLKQNPLTRRRAITVRLNISDPFYIWINLYNHFGAGHLLGPLGPHTLIGVVENDPDGPPGGDGCVDVIPRWKTPNVLMDSSLRNKVSTTPSSTKRNIDFGYECADPAIADDTQLALWMRDQNKDSGHHISNPNTGAKARAQYVANNTAGQMLSGEWPLHLMALGITNTADPYFSRTQFYMPDGYDGDVTVFMEIVAENFHPSNTVNVYLRAGVVLFETYQITGSTEGDKLYPRLQITPAMGAINHLGIQIETTEVVLKEVRIIVSQQGGTRAISRYPMMSSPLHTGVDASFSGGYLDYGGNHAGFGEQDTTTGFLAARQNYFKYNAADWIGLDYVEFFVVFTQIISFGSQPKAWLWDLTAGVVATFCVLNAADGNEVDDATYWETVTPGSELLDPIYVSIELPMVKLIDGHVYYITFGNDPVLGNDDWPTFIYDAGIDFHGYFQRAPRYWRLSKYKLFGPLNGHDWIASRMKLNETPQEAYLEMAGHRTGGTGVTIGAANHGLNVSGNTGLVQVSGGNIAPGTTRSVYRGSEISANLVPGNYYVARSEGTGDELQVDSLFLIIFAFGSGNKKIEVGIASPNFSHPELLNCLGPNSGYLISFGDDLVIAATKSPITFWLKEGSSGPFVKKFVIDDNATPGETPLKVAVGSSEPRRVKIWEHEGQEVLVLDTGSSAEGFKTASDTLGVSFTESADVVELDEKVGSDTISVSVTDTGSVAALIEKTGSDTVGVDMVPEVESHFDAPFLVFIPDPSTDDGDEMSSQLIGFPEP